MHVFVTGETGSFGVGKYQVNMTQLAIYRYVLPNQPIRGLVMIKSAVFDFHSPALRIMAYVTFNIQLVAMRRLAECIKR